MTSIPYVGQSSRHTGDINLVSALMACGIPLDVLDPVSVVESDRGKYGSYNVAEYSEDGLEDVETLLGHWGGTAPLPDDHGFAFICRFIRSRPMGIHRTADLLDYAVSYLRERDHALPGLAVLADVPSFVNSLPKGEAAHVLAYVWNRELCFQLYRTASRKIFYQEGTGRDARRALLDTRLPKWQAREILSRLQG